MALTDKLTAIGNAIREKTGETELLSLDGMAAAIAAIEAGGGGNIRVATGTYTPASDVKFTSWYNFTHNCGFVPRVFILYTHYVSIPEKYSLNVALTVLLEKPSSTSSKGVASTVITSTASGYTWAQSVVAENTLDSHFSTARMNETTMGIVAGHTSYNNYFRAGANYRWIAIGDWEGGF